MTPKYTGNIEFSIITAINTWTFPVKGEVCYFCNNRFTKQNYKTNNCFQKYFLIIIFFPLMIRPVIGREIVPPQTLMLQCQAQN